MLVAASGSGYIAELLKLMGVSPGTAGHVQDLLLRPLSVVLFIAGTILVAALGSRLIRRAVNRLSHRAKRGGDPAQASRIDTVGRIAANAFRVVIYVIGLITTLSLLGVNLAPFLAGATVIGATIGFGAQSLVRDFLSGLLMLLEDQYRIGDAIEVNDVSGTVEEVSLRVTRLRDADGTIWFIPNGQILKLGNHSRHWSRALLSSTIAIGVSIEEASDVIEAAAKQAVAPSAIAEKIVAGPMMLGVSKVSTDAVTIDLEVRTTPLAGDEVVRAMREAVTIALGRAHMLPVVPPA